MKTVANQLMGCRNAGLLVRAIVGISVAVILFISASERQVDADGKYRFPLNRGHNSGPRPIDWRLEKTTGDKPSARGGGKMVAVGNRLVVLYGFFECFEETKCEHQYFDEVYTLDVTTKRWEKKHPKSASGTLPAKRVFFGAATYKKRKTAVIYGGSEYSVKTVSTIKMYDDMWEYNPETDTMVERKFTNEGPGRRLGPEIVISNDMLYLFGGYDLGLKAHNDLWSYNLLTNTWKQLKQDNDPQSPSKRYIFRFEVGSSNKGLFLFGGNYRETKTIQRNDLFRYNIPTNTFTPIISEENTNITGRTHGASAIYGDLFMIALGDIPSGGCHTEQASEQQNPTKEVWSIRIDGRSPSSKWQPVEIGFSPPPLKRVIYATLGDRLYVTQGFDYKCDDPKTAGPIYNLETYSFPLKELR
ncbi:MAG TPA: kelch repeat-containing protein [Pyrinomonadaceae bacterium]|nr:kelch repeat-containing protein [Pyrinomonadaceae bacterium]